MRAPVFVLALLALGASDPLRAQTTADATVALVAPPATAPLHRADAGGTNANAVVLGPGDVVRITVWRRPELSGEFLIAADGSITHPLYRAVTVGGVPLDAAEERVETFLKRFEETPQFVLEPLLHISVSGEVMRPNLYTVGPGTAVTQAVALAGGPSVIGRRDRVVVVRAGKAITVDLSRLDVGGSQMPIRSGDQIFVERQRSVFREFIAPAITLTGSAAAILTVVLRANHGSF
jgi:polysaccharide export outer membrane protein